MASTSRLEIAKNIILDGRIKVFRDVFLYVYKSEISGKLGINYTRFLNLVNNPKRLRYDEAMGVAKILQVPARTISELIHNQIEEKKK